MIDSSHPAEPRAHDIIDSIDGVRQSKTVTLARCPSCGSMELIVSDVEREGYAPEKWPAAVHCGGCGARGPWGWTEFRAVERWNAVGGVETFSLTAWKPVPKAEELQGSDLPF